MEAGHSSSIGILAGRVDESCGAEPFPINSGGIWNLMPGETLLHYALPRLQLQLSIIFLLTYILHLYLNRFGFPRIVSEILAGIIIGPTFLGRNKKFSELLFPREADTLLIVLTRIGYLFFMFIIGVKMDMRMVPNTGKKAWTIGSLSLLIPLSMVLSSSSALTKIVNPEKQESIKIASATLALTPFPVIACLLLDLKIINSELGRLSLSSAVISDLLSVFLTTAANFSRTSKEASHWIAAQSLILSAALILVIVFVMRPITFLIIRKTPEGKPVKEVYIIFMVLMVLLSALSSEYAGLQYLFGPFILGLAVPDGPPLGSTLVERLDSFISGLLAPLLLSYCGYKINIIPILDVKTVVILWIIAFVALVGKITATLLPALYCKMPLKDATALALIMSAKGIVELGSLVSIMELKTIDDEIFAVMSSTVFLTAAVVPLLVRALYDPSKKYAGYQKRNILHSSKNAELRILACIHRQEDAFAAVKLLEASNPTKESPISVYALNLVELVGRSSPLLINHQLGQKASLSSGSRSQHIIDIFNYYKQQHLGQVTVQVFTAISPPKFMHDDICSLAFDKSASLIILPFHRKWSNRGKMISDNNALRTLNCYVLDKAPCSVGILVDRREVRGPSSILSISSSYCMAVVFFGGDDDREALAYAKRMARCSSVHLTVVRFIAQEAMHETGWETMLDAEALKDIKVKSPQDGDIVYREQIVKDGSDTALAIRSMERRYELIMVGRRHKMDSPLTSGLEQWRELPELGVVGDLLASSDIKSAVSVLVVQQQHLQCK